MALISKEFSVIDGYLMHREMSNPEGTTQFWRCVIMGCPGRGQNAMGRKDHQQIESHSHVVEQLRSRLVALPADENHPFEIVWTALADGESIPKILTTGPSGLILEWRRMMTRRKNGISIEFYRCLSCEVNNIHKREKLPHLCVDATKPTSRTLVTDPEMIRHICCEVTYVPMSFGKTGALVDNFPPQEEEINFRPMNNSQVKRELFEDADASRETCDSSDPPETKKQKLEDRSEQPDDIWSDFGVMIASLTRRTAAKNIDRAFQLQQGIFKLLHDSEERNHTT